jgi:mycofactocin precursor peptide peptidase
MTTWPDCAGTTLLLIPCGSYEQHGPHLPLDTDARVAAAVCARAAADLGADGIAVQVAPALAYGASGEHQSFPGTLSIGHEALYQVLLELGRSASTWAGAVLFVNGHGGNLPTVGRAVDAINGEGRRAGWVPCVPDRPDADAHAGWTETSLLLALDPAAVRLELATAGATAPLADLMPALQRGGVSAVSANGVLGDPRGAGPAEGERMLTEMSATVVRAAAELLR